MNNQFPQRVSDIVTCSKEEANGLKSRYIGPKHLLLDMLRDSGGKAIEILMKLDIDLKKVKKRTESFLREAEDDTLLPDTDIPLSPMATKILKMCILGARVLESATADTERVLLAILKDGSNSAAAVLKENCVDYQFVFEQLTMQFTNLNAGMGFQEGNKEDGEDINISHSSRSTGMGAASSARIASKQPSNDTPVSGDFGIDMTRAAEGGKLDPVVGRKREIERLAQILSHRKRNNPVLIGESGVGKSAIVEGLALHTVQKKVSRILFDERVVMFDMASVVTGTKYRGQFKERIRSIISELRKDSNMILFIDKIRTIVGVGAAAGSMDTANMLKPALAHGRIQYISTTTLDEYRENIERDGALERRFQKVIVEPTTLEETLQILKNIKEEHEEHHNVSYTDEALKACVELSDCYVADRNFPDKAVDALDEVGSRVHLMNINVPKEVEVQERLIEDARVLKVEAVRSQNFESAANYRDREKELSVHLDEMKAEWKARLKGDHQTVGEEEIASIISMMSGVPVQRMAQTEGIKLAGMKEDLQGKAVARDTAIEKLAKTILHSRIGLKNPNRPTGTFMFLGPIDVGETHLAKQPAKYMFGSSDALIHIDMSEYMGKYTVSHMVGAAPGYVGHEEGRWLTEKIRRKPYSIVLLDEIEKARPDIFNILLQILNEGRLTGDYGRTINLKNTVIIMTSNIGIRQLKEFSRNVGFAAQARMNDNEHSRNVIQKALNKTFAPEFLNRSNEIITFDQLSLDTITKIVDIGLKGLYGRVEAIGYRMVVDDEAKRFLATKGYDVRFGACPLKRVIQNYLEDGLSRLTISAGLQPGDTINVSVDKEEGELNITKA